MYGKEMYIKLSLSIVDDVDVVEKNQTCQSYHCIDQYFEPVCRNANTHLLLLTLLMLQTTSAAEKS